ncbi:hypothetical protein INT43_004989 [Umbelopsis isabellina]|uniref:Uncharacterized protein n=1 Tax=Mortierella isabellina TaxID=91625 RepID=A0A8H7U8R2_MORIS|nr:hypothetical protein INT43_004989 [Umbelopsis isabellina]
MPFASYLLNKKKKVTPFVELRRPKTWHICDRCLTSYDRFQNFEMHVDKCSLSKCWLIGPKYLQLATTEQDNMTKNKKKDQNTHIYYGQDHTRFDMDACNDKPTWLNNLHKTSCKVALFLTTRFSAAVHTD